MQNKQVNAEIVETVKTESEPYARLQTILMSAEPIDRAPCDVHPFSLCQRPRVDIDTTTTPCRDYSLWNPAAKGRQGNDVAVLLGWCSIHKHDKTPVLIHDSVVNFDFGVIVENLAATYDFIHFDNISSQNIGEGGIMNGDRPIEVGMHKDDELQHLCYCVPT